MSIPPAPSSATPPSSPPSSIPDITTIESGAFKGLGSLTWLRLQNNGELRVWQPTGSATPIHHHPAPTPDIKTIESGAFDGLDSLERLFFWGNNLTCSDIKDEVPSNVYSACEDLGCVAPCM